MYRQHTSAAGSVPSANGAPYNSLGNQPVISTRAEGPAQKPDLKNIAARPNTGTRLDRGMNGSPGSRFVFSAPGLHNGIG